MSWIFREPEQDRRLGAALRRLESEFPDGKDDLLRQKILAAAKPHLAGLRAPASPEWWEWLSRWISVAVPIGVAASLVAGLLVSVGQSPESAYTVEAGADSTLVTAAFADASTGTEVASQFITPSGGEWLFEQVLSQ